ncbi:MAG: DinB family protein [Spirochaetes bacterium]|nr:DinB family protein [Spirochaetota bacterium]
MPINNYRELINDFSILMQKHQKISSIRIDETKWTLKEMIGHLIDSASNNHQRFIRLQTEKEIIFPYYDPEEWKNISKVNIFDCSQLISLWKNYNDFLIHIITNINPANLENVWKTSEGNKSLDFLVSDYLSHMKIHYDMFEERAAEIISNKIKKN